jgi:hypothetical protein
VPVCAESGVNEVENMYLPSPASTSMHAKGHEKEFFFSSRLEGSLTCLPILSAFATR